MVSVITVGFSRGRVLGHHVGDGRVSRADRLGIKGITHEGGVGFLGDIGVVLLLQIEILGVPEGGVLIHIGHIAVAAHGVAVGAVGGVDPFGVFEMPASSTRL